MLVDLYWRRRLGRRRVRVIRRGIRQRITAVAIVVAAGIVAQRLIITLLLLLRLMVLSGSRGRCRRLLLGLSLLTGCCRCLGSLLLLLLVVLLLGGRMLLSLSLGLGLLLLES